MTRTRLLKLLLGLANEQMNKEAAINLAGLAQHTGKPGYSDAVGALWAIEHLANGAAESSSRRFEQMRAGNHASAHQSLKWAADELDVLADVLRAMAKWTRREAREQAEKAGAR